jgi:hypothetical protein
MTYWILAVEVIVVAAFGFLFFYIKRKIDEEREGE